MQPRRCPARSLERKGPAFAQECSVLSGSRRLGMHDASFDSLSMFLGSPIAATRGFLTPARSFLDNNRADPL